ncbi:unnamed protein product [Prunus armeniaca]|uniref:Uncharacterized protein n=1 Tax=Prunus armeniaca TaxID=36596 RepID=A0A6J5TJC2_PRUAR|nr:unnamed protein product [Prunus armeniaca]CAB4293366.1 unnamed protein product [Prunus armeniaca]
MFNPTLGINFDTSSAPLAIPPAMNGYLLPHRLPMLLFISMPKIEVAAEARMPSRLLGRGRTWMLKPEGFCVSKALVWVEMSQGANGKELGLFICGNT